ncbi:nibrin [Ooceraea biroi]|uniref:nibrin n=1 Tax=Ooceraea biroi TaxID=2015173 RepID=UPI000F07BEEF|nr:nibrin [Ooceraea biroi]
MWCLKGREGICVYVTPNQKQTFGKSLSDIKLEGDPTISRLHAVISVESIEESDTTPYKCVISDLSKYGTFVIRDGQKKKLLINEKCTLKAGDTVQFGLKQTTFVVSCYSFVIAKSSLDKKAAESLTSVVHLLGGRLAETWEDSCTHLTVSENILFTTKLACALASAKPIVTIAYWEAIRLAVQESKELPGIENFLPMIKEEWLKASSRLLVPNEKRRALFKGLAFVHFCAKQYFTCSPLISAAGGKSCVYPTKKPLTPRDLTAKNAVVVQQPASDSSQFTCQIIEADYPIIYRKLQAIKRRMISDTEIPLAILYCSTEIYCNPKFEFATFLELNTQTFPSSDIVIIEDTQDIVNRINKADGRSKENVVSEICVSQSNENAVSSTSVCPLGENARRGTCDSNRSDIATRTTRNADQRTVTRKVIPEICESQGNDQGTSKNVGPHIGDEQRNIMPNIFSKKKVQKQLEIIPESCCSAGREASGTVSGKSDREQARIVSEIFEPDEVNVVEDLAARKICRNAKSSEKRGILTVEKGNDGTLEKDAVAPVAITTNQQRENYVISKKTNNSHCVKNNLSLGKNGSSNADYDKSDRANWQISKKLKTSRGPRIVSIEKINHSKINTDWKRKKALTEGRTKIQESSNSLKERKLDPVCSVGRPQEDERTKKNRIREGDKNREEPRKTVANWYEKYLKQELTNEILRRDAPRGKTFTKMPVVIPERMPRMDNHVSRQPRDFVKKMIIKTD